MTGGGARAAYQVGAARALFEISGKDQNFLQMISGNSAGAINSLYLAANAQDWDVATHNLIALWRGLTPQKIYDLRIKSISEIGLKWLGGTMFGGMTKDGSPLNHFLDTAPLRKLLTKEIDFTQVKRNLDSSHLSGISLATTNFNTGSNVVFYQSKEDIPQWSRTDRFSVKTNITVDHVMASSAIPFFFPPIQIQDSFYGDGCIRQTTPLSPAIHLGAEKIIAIGVRHPHNQDVVRTLTLAASKNPTLGQILGTMMNAIFLDSLEADVERLQRINSLIESNPNSSLKKIDILMLRPSKDLGKMTQKLNEELPRTLRYLLKGIGVSDDEGLDLLSYLAFDKAYTLPLMELGYDDTMKRRDEIARFIGA